MITYVHIYRSPERGLRAIGSPDRDWHGRPSTLLRTYRILDDGNLFEVPVRFAERAAS